MELQYLSSVSIHIHSEKLYMCLNDCSMLMQEQTILKNTCFIALSVPFQFIVYLILDTLWVEVTVESEMTMALVEQLAALPVPSSNSQVKFVKAILFCMINFN